MKMQVNSQVQKSIRQAAEWRLLSLLVSRPRNGWLNEIRYLAREISPPALHEAAAGAAAARQEAYLAVFGPGGTISPREVSYIGFEDPGNMMSDLQHFYNSFGYRPHSEDPPDHITVETGYAGYLLLKHAYALSAQDNEAAEITEAALKHFLESHLARLIHGIASKASANEPDYLQRTIRELAKRVAHLPRLPLRQARPAETETLHCGI